MAKRCEAENADAFVERQLGRLDEQAAYVRGAAETMRRIREDSARLILKAQKKD